MNFVDNITEDEYKKFLRSFKYAHFTQTVTFAKATSLTRNQIPIYVGVKDTKGKILCAALLLKKALPFGFSYMYSPRGFSIDFNNKDLLIFFTEELKKYAKKNKVIYIKIDPEIIINYLNEDASVKACIDDNFRLIDYMKSLGYRHGGYNKLHEKNQPRYSYRRDLRKYNSFEEIENSFSKTFLKTVKRSFNYDLEVELFGNVDSFFDLNKTNAIKNNFVQYPDLFYKTLYDEGRKNNNILVVNIYMNPKLLYKKASEELLQIDKEINNGKNKKGASLIEKKNRILKDIQILEESKNNGKTIICSMISGYESKNMWTMYIGNSKLGEYFFANNRVYYETIKYAYENKFNFIDLFGTVGDVNTKYRNLGHLHEYKKKFGDDYIEFVGEFDLINKKLLYFFLPFLLSIYRKVIKHGNKRN